MFLVASNSYLHCGYTVKYMFLNFSTQLNSIGRRNRYWKTALGSLFNFHFPVFRTKQDAWHKRIRLNYKLSLTYPRLAIFSLRELHQTSPSTLRAETSFRYQYDPPENQTCHTDELQGGASLACYQSTLISGTSFFSQLYFPSSGRSTNEIYERSLQALLSSAPRGFAARSRVLARLVSLAQIGELARRLRLLVTEIWVHDILKKDKGVSSYSLASNFFAWAPY